MSLIARESPAYWEASGSAINVGMRLAPVVYCLVALAGCMSSAPIGPTTPVDLQIKVAAGRTTDVPEAAIRLHFQGVMGDSRCPADAICVWGGDALVRIDVQSTAAGQVTYDLHTGSMQPVHHAEVTIALVDLSPYPFSGRPISPDEYRATFRITR